MKKKDEHNIFQKVKEIEDNREEDVAKFDRKEKRVNKCDWKDPMEVNEYTKDKRSTERMNLFRSVAPDGKCCNCGREIEDMRRGWVYLRNLNKAICRSCYFSETIVAGRDLSDLDEDLILDIDERFKVNGLRIEEMRRERGYSIRRFAELCGWSATKQIKIEQGTAGWLNGSDFEIMMRNLAS